MPARLPVQRLRWVNVGVSGPTTAQLPARHEGACEEAPDRVFCLIDASAARQRGPDPSESIVSESETREDRRALRAQADVLRNARWVLMAPTPVQSGTTAGRTQAG
jgi:hypothetical protein